MIFLRIRRKLRRPLRLSGKAWDRTASLALGQAVKAVVTVRAFTKGLDTDDRPFAPYTPSYLAKRLASGRGARVNLTWTGTLSRSLRIKSASKTRLVVGLGASAARYGTHVNAARQFMGLSPSDMRFLRKVIRRLARDALVRARGKVVSKGGKVK